MSDIFDHFMDAMEDNMPGGRYYEEGDCPYPGMRTYGPPKRQKYPKDKRSKELANTLKGLLKQKGIKVHINQAASGSCYLTFPDERIGQGRIGNHDELSRLGYRWQVRWDLDEKKVVKHKGHNQFIYPSNQLRELASHIYNYYQKILSTGDEFECV